MTPGASPTGAVPGAPHDRAGRRPGSRLIRQYVQAYSGPASVCLAAIWPSSRFQIGAWTMVGTPSSSAIGQ
ncbi:hypothetical protein AB0H92_09550, partial [Streptomyces phaeochromogenes]|uniref:hypothetical protein n=1 Tax=Streptomyces phaeochromogenes TaxID=1923 RepID=UPI0033E0FDDB